MCYGRRIETLLVFIAAANEWATVASCSSLLIVGSLNTLSRNQRKVSAIAIPLVFGLYTIMQQ